ncbi:alpha/beta fold hydrolase [Dietzia sp. NCCP-2495]|uniref:alpha/beta fold hydrolase n=1 Tax=Dietzia sp. NCCP-2495 TaxID=2934675 RepID=UPI00223249CD|nr:alpha/beta hydrolase [Dietzia sp. NCCP-2495]
MSTSVRVNGVELAIEEFGAATDPLVVLIGGPTMLSWPVELCRLLAAGGRRVVRYDLRDVGGSTLVDPDAPGYTLRDLAADAAALVAALGAGSDTATPDDAVPDSIESAGGPATRTPDRSAHVAGIGVSGMVAQVAVLDHPEAVSALTLVGTRSVAPGPVDDDLPDHDMAVMQQMFSGPEPDWSDRAAVAEEAARRGLLLGNDPDRARETAAAIWDRTPSPDPSVQRANQGGTVFARIDCTPRWRERLSELTVPTLVVHGRHDPFFPVGNGEAIAAEVPGARLLVVEDMGTALPLGAIGEVAEAMLEVTGRHEN